MSIAGAGALAAAGCTSGGPQQQTPGATQPRIATYRCGEDGDIRVVNTGASVLVSENRVAAEPENGQTGEAGEVRFELAAAPPNQRSRYGAEGLALVIDGREALWMKAGESPMTCLR